MALQLTVETQHGFNATDAYHRVENVALKSKSVIEFDVLSYKDSGSSAAFDAKSFLCDYNLSGSNPIAQAYEHIKTLPEFAGATDV
jgi:hypothetical protein